MTKRKKRRLQTSSLDFKNGYAVGWHFAIGECFKDQLDIKQTERMETLIANDGTPLMEPVTDYENGKQKLDKNGMLPQDERAQSLEVGLDNRAISSRSVRGTSSTTNPEAYELKWGDALKVIGKCCRVIEATPDTLLMSSEELEDVSPGSVTFSVTAPKKDGSGLEGRRRTVRTKSGRFCRIPEDGNIRLEG